VTGPRVLVLDDSLTVRMELGDLLEEAGFAVVLCATVAEARAALAEPPALALLDVHLPDGDGLDLLAELRAGGQTLPALMLSSEDEVAARARGLTAECVGKPFDAEHVVARATALARPGGATVLVIDDSPTFRAELAGALSGDGYHVVEAGTGEDGLRLAARVRPGAAVIDGRLPGIDGATVIARLRLDPALRRLPCLMLTGSEGVLDEVGGLDAGADAYLRKGTGLDVVRARLGALLRSAATPAAVDSPLVLSPRRLLAVDDSPTFLNGLAESLRGDGYDVALARSGAEALAYLERARVDAILLDVMMPELSGEETCRRIKAGPFRDIPVLMLTARDDRDGMIAGLNAGAEDYIAKSSDFEVLRGRLRAQLRRKQFEDENQRMRDELHRKEAEAASARMARELAETRARYLEDVERKNLELDRARRQAEDASRVKSEFLANMSHEIRTPMNAILGFTDILLDEETQHERRDRLKVVQRAGKQLLSLIDDILDHSKIEAGMLEIHAAPFSPREMVAQLEALFASKARDRRLAFEVRVDAAVPARLVGDDHRLNQVLTNLLGNAFKFTHAGSVTLAVEQQDGRTRFVVRDTGIGIAPEKRARVWKPFEQADRSTTRQYGGTGLGLAITRNLVELMGGEITLDSEAGSGSAFTVSLPLPAAPGAQGDAMVQRWLDAQELPELRDLLVENLGTRVRGEVDALARAVAAGAREEIHRRAHAIKGWSGSFKMTELYQPIVALDALASAGDLDLVRARELVAEAAEVVGRIPEGYAPARGVAAIASAAKRRVLVVDDNEMNRQLMRTLLGKLGLPCELAENGVQALELLRASRYDLVLLDMEMPVMDGWQTIREIRADGALADLDVVALTAHAVSGSAERCLAAGCDGYLSKPLDAARFRALLETRLSGGGNVTMSRRLASAQI
jgi:DNA-binding response OmpR family regulator/HPt (histidine-containing phosphotransfer) domain-containing protein